ncbi:MULTISPECIES: calcium-binding protein [unclassified Microcoleus]|uniref:calcium-binding protein n=1 Tax=unclassified Microcoleus TaxID=2642155 RepID=UPI002FD6B09E
MANYDIFDEQYYLSQYPWLKPAIDAGIIKSGREHFEKFGQAGGLTAVSRYFDEQTYLAQNQDLVPSIRNSSNPNAPFASGLDHFIQFGYEQGRTRVSLDYDEAFYLKRYPVLVPFVQNGTFKSGLEHFIKFGAKEGLYANTFFESEYLLQHPAVATAVKAGVFKTGGEHYRKFGQFEPALPFVDVNFFGTSGNDTVQGFGVENVNIFGVQYVLDANGRRQFQSYGSDEFDTLIGGSGRDNFVLAVTVPGVGGSRPTPTNLGFYEGPGFAKIQNFTQGQDTIYLGSTSFDKYIVFPINNNRDLAIQTNGLPFFTPNGGNQLSYGDTIAVIEGGGNLSLKPLFIPTKIGTFLG